MFKHTATVFLFCFVSVIGYQKAIADVGFSPSSALSEDVYQFQFGNENNGSSNPLLDFDSWKDVDSMSQAQLFGLVPSKEDTVAQSRIQNPTRYEVQLRDEATTVPEPGMLPFVAFIVFVLLSMSRIRGQKTRKFKSA